MGDEADKPNVSIAACRLHVVDDADALRIGAELLGGAASWTSEIDVHRNVSQHLFHAMVAHYLVGTGWRFVASEPDTGLLRADLTPADVDLQLSPAGRVIVDVQLKASGTLGLHDNIVDAHIHGGSPTMSTPWRV